LIYYVIFLVLSAPTGEFGVSEQENRKDMEKNPVVSKNHFRQGENRFVIADSSKV
jgi:hypothetical protein